ncbi:MAG: DUF2997 domain-containing protein [Lentisphaerae bacterium]|jgi:hypothetical protein|nr:DUF2997 domain-containing protein [Lentisphaerota bacterium]MBT4822132.1 DUF2997 domain-containing protein [Lentisphaerota bacterium]MBT5610529.1 DUF2997 domain-containing protein [Lentisphaerota bacterium]MBT7056084.1 DUF2997 domain-containing protein [Lentisphaerota bacterium]MBT7842441.1 DUF2997 domain-containing protein [Lentisphaerota bacterium]
MNQPTIEVTVRPDGSIEIDAVGFRGGTCEQATAFLEQALGPVASKQRKPEYYRHAVVRKQQRIGR